MEQNNNNHRPHHIYGSCGYFITARIYRQHPYFSTNERSKIFIRKFSILSKQLGIGIIAWALLSNHYHAIIRLTGEGAVNHHRFILAEFFRKLHSQTATVLNKVDGTPGRKVWYQYWDYCLRDEKDFWKHFNYIVQQPLKHGIVKNLRDAYGYKHSSNPTWLRRLTEQGLSESFEKYPVRNWTPIGEE